MARTHLVSEESKGLTRWLGSFPPRIGECRKQSGTTFSEGMDIWKTLPSLEQILITSSWASNTSMFDVGTISGWTLCNSYSLKTPPTSSIGNSTLRTRCQSLKMPTAHLFLYLVLLSLRKFLLARLFSGGKTFLRPWQKLTGKMYLTSSSRRFWNANLLQRETIGWLK